jgi:competence protein ComEA
VDELSKAGLSAKSIDKIRPLVTVGSAAPAKEVATKTKAPAAPASAAKGEKALVDLNSASQKELETLPGVGAATAKKITANRPYKSVDELSKAGLSAKSIDKIRPLVTVGSAAPAKEVATKAPAPPAAAKVTSEKAAPSSGKQAPTAPAKLAPGEKVNINTASQQQLEALPGIGPAKAKAIIGGRPYEKIEDIMKVKGIKEGVFNKIKDLITVK